MIKLSIKTTHLHYTQFSLIECAYYLLVSNIVNVCHKTDLAVLWYNTHEAKTSIIAKLTWKKQQQQSQWVIHGESEMS